MSNAARFWRVMFPRLVADVLIVGGSLLTGFLVPLLLAIRNPAVTRPAELVNLFRAYFVELGPLLAAILIAIFAVSGVYTRKRFYTPRHKTLALAQGISLAYAVFLLAAYLLWYSNSFFLPRGAFLISYFMTLAGAIGVRCLKSYLLARFRIEPRQPAPDRPSQNVLVVGGAGYIGSVLVRDLLAEGYRVRVLDSLIFGDESVRDLYRRPNFELVKGDFRHVEPVVWATKGIDAVIHLGAIVGDPACALDEDETLETNLAATRLLADVCRASGVSRILFASTCSVYGAADHLVDERSQLNPVSLYAATKIDSEHMLLAARSRQFHPVILRLATAFGWSYRPRFDLAVNLLAARAAADGVIQIFNPAQWRPFIHVADTSRALRAVLRARLEIVSGEIFNIGSDSMNYTLLQLADELSALRPGLRVDHGTNSDSRNYRVCFHKVRQQLGFQCQVTLAEGISELLEKLGRGLVSDYRDSRYSNVQLVASRHRDGRARDEISLTALRFAKNSRWWKTAAAGASGQELLRETSTGLAALARAVPEATVPTSP